MPNDVSSTWRREDMQRAVKRARTMIVTIPVHVQTMIRTSTYDRKKSSLFVLMFFALLLIQILVFFIYYI